MMRVCVWLVSDGHDLPIHHCRGTISAPAKQATFWRMATDESLSTSSVESMVHSGHDRYRHKRIRRQLQRVEERLLLEWLFERFHRVHRQHFRESFSSVSANPKENATDRFNKRSQIDEQLINIRVLTGHGFLALVYFLRGFMGHEMRRIPLLWRSRRNRTSGNMNLVK